MVSGDIVNFVTPALNTAINYQPALGVEIMITQWSLGGVNVTPNFTDGVFISACANFWSAVPNYKIFINNTNYLHVQANVGQRGSFCGIQLK
jgi:hypothetical protein